MKHLLLTLSSLTNLTLTSTGIITTINTNINNTITNKSTNKSEIKDSSTSLFNNEWSSLNNSDWITNQSTDHKFYSYDTSSLAKYTFTNARKTFLVDSLGILTNNPKVTIPDKDKSKIENTKQEMIDHKKITSIKNTYNPYSKSEYTKDYFSGDNTNWQYLQFGGIEKEIDISKQSGADKVEHSNSLSETLGLYYIAKAARENKITKAIADNLGTYFINQISIKDSFNKDLTNTIINLIIDNTAIYNFIYEAPMIDSQTNSYKNYSLNYIFDSSNNLVKTYYI